MKKIIIIFILLVLGLFFSILFMVNRNNNYITNLKEDIKKNYDVTGDINYFNHEGLYYIIIDNKNLIVIDEKYQEVLKESKEKLYKINKEYEIVYKLNQALYEEKIQSKEKITYNYYDIYTGELLNNIAVGG